METLGGNTKTPKVRENQLTKWVFTLNNYTEDDILEILETCKAFCKKWGFQTEIGEEGTPHLQGAIWLKKAMRWSEFKLSKNIHWEKMKSDKGSNDYVQKDESFAGRRWNSGLEPPEEPLDIITELYPWQQKCLDIYNTKPHPRHIHWFWKKEGGSGKSEFVKYMVHHHGVMFCRGGKASDVINMCFNHNMRKTKLVIWDLPRNTGNAISYQALECIKDGLIANTKYETGALIFNRPHIFIFANSPPMEDEDETMMSKDKFVVHEL